MFKIYFVNSAYKKDQVLMYDDTRDDDDLKLGNPKLHIEVNTAGTLDFELPSTNVAYSRIIPMVTELHVIKDNQKTHDKHIWFGRVLTIDTDLYGLKTVHCEGGLAYLNDCIYYDKTVDMGSWSTPKTVGRAMFARYESPTLNESGVHVYGVSPQEASAVIANIMSGGSNYKENLNAPFKHLGRIAKYTDPDSNVPVYAWVNEPVIPSGDQNDDDYYFYEGNLNSTVQKQCGISNPNNMTAIDLISSMMSNAGGLFWVSKTSQYPKQTFGGADLGDAVYVMQLHMRRYYPAFNPREGQTIQLGENLTDLTITDDGTTFFTAVHPHGQLGDSGEDLTLGRRGDLTGTTAVNKRNWKIDPDHGVMYCPELVERYGMIIRDLDVGTTNMYEQLVGMGMSEIDKIPLVSRTVDGSWTSGVRELTVKGIDLSLYNVDYSSIELTDAVRVLAPRYGIDTYLNATAIDYDLQNVENTVYTLNAIKTANEITDASPSYGSNSISPSSGSSYVHPKHTEHDLGLYKFSNDNLGHVDSAVAVTKKDITALGIPGEDTNTTYKLVQYQDILGSLYAVFYPVVALKDSSGNHTKIVVPNVRINAQGKLLYNECYGNLQNTDKYASLGDILFTTPNFFVFSTYNICASFIVSYDELECIVNVHLWSNLNGYEHAEIFTTSELSIPNVKWTVLRSYPGAPEGFEKNTCVFRICVDQESMKKIRNVHGSVYLEYSTGYDGGIVESVQKTDSVDTYLQTFHNDHVVQTDVILSSSNASNVAFTGDYNDLSNKPAIPDISSKQDKSTAVTHSANTAVGSATKPVYVAANGVATAISHSINSDVPANAKFTDTTYNDATQSTHGLMTAADKKKLDGLDASRFMNLNNSAIVIYGAGGTAQWYRLGTLVSSGNFNTAIIRILSGDGANGHARQNSSFEIHIKDAWQSTETISAKACGVTVYRINCANAEVKVIPTAHDTYTVWAYLPWGYWNGDYAVYGKYKSWTSQRLTQPDEPEGTAADTAYYDQAFLTSTVAKSTEATTLTDSGWSSVTTYIVDKSKFNNISTEFRRIGQIAWVKCSFTPNVAMTDITICDVTKVDPFVAVTPTNAVYGTGSNNAGTESFIANISYNPNHKLYLRGNFKPSTIYRLMFSYPVT